MWLSYTLRTYVRTYWQDYLFDILKDQWSMLYVSSRLTCVARGGKEGLRGWQDTRLHFFPAKADHVPSSSTAVTDNIGNCLSHHFEETDLTEHFSIPRLPVNFQTFCGSETTIGWFSGYTIGKYSVGFSEPCRDGQCKVDSCRTLSKRVYLV